MKHMRSSGKAVRGFFILFFLIVTFCLPQHSLAASAEEININVDATLKRFKLLVPGGVEFLQKAKGVLVFPSVVKAGFFIGGEYGEGALRVGGKTVGYYSTAAGSIGLQLGAQSKSVVLVFLQNKALADFRQTKGWKVGLDGSVALVNWGTGGDVNTIDIKDPIVGFVFGNKGLMFNLTLEGSKFSPIVR
ncbi:MAG: YSC84-related protein [Pseudomonadota bacterium]|nr:YSC84-related protein [Pseudomonadota bacterium]MEA3428506.1 YSC84-related protein [Thermodesulfobacteriota bacterium]